MTVAAIAQGLVSGLAERIALRGNASPQVDDVAPPQGIGRLCQQRGADYRTDSGQGLQDGHVTLLFWLPRRWLLGIGGRRRELVEEPVELRLRRGELLVDHDEAFREQAHMYLGGARCGSIDGQRVLLQLALQRGAVEAPSGDRGTDPVAWD